jgi:hypothetical protein
VEHACEQCGASVEDGVAFCLQCHAPQIRIAGADSVPHLQGTPEGACPQPTSYPGALPAQEIQWGQALPASAIAGVVAAILMIVPLGAFGLGMLAAGALSVVLYRRRNPAANLTPGMGARLGAVSGALGFGIFAVLTSIEMVAFRSGGQLRAALIEAVQQSAARSSDPQAQQLVEYLKTPQGLALVMVLALLVMFAAFLVLSSLGGALSAALLRRKDLS